MGGVFQGTGGIVNISQRAITNATKENLSKKNQAIFEKSLDKFMKEGETRSDSEVLALNEVAKIDQKGLQDAITKALNEKSQELKDAGIEQQASTVLKEETPADKLSKQIKKSDPIDRLLATIEEQKVETKEEEPLVQEARKYKSAEEFVNRGERFKQNINKLIKKARDNFEFNESANSTSFARKNTGRSDFIKEFKTRSEAQYPKSVSDELTKLGLDPNKNIYIHSFFPEIGKGTGFVREDLLAILKDSHAKTFTTSGFYKEGDIFFDKLVRDGFLTRISEPVAQFSYLGQKLIASKEKGLIKSKFNIFNVTDKVKDFKPRMTKGEFFDQAIRGKVGEYEIFKKMGVKTKQELIDIWNKAQEKSTTKKQAPTIKKPTTKKKVKEVKPTEEEIYKKGKEIIDKSIKNNEAVILDPDELKKIYNDYDPKNHKIYSSVNKKLFEYALQNVKNKTVKFIAGGSGSGKSNFVTSVLAENFNGIILDGTLSNYDSFIDKLIIAKENGKKVKVSGIITNVGRAWKYVKKREKETGRGVPLDVFIDKHIGSAQTMIKIIENNNDVAVELKDTRKIRREDSAKNVKFLNDKKYIL